MVDHINSLIQKAGRPLRRYSRATANLYSKYISCYPPDYYDGGYCGYCFVAVEAVMQFVVPEAGYVVQTV